VIVAGLFAGPALLVPLVVAGFGSLPPQPAKRTSRKSHRNAELWGLRMFHLFRALGWRVHLVERSAEKQVPRPEKVFFIPAGDDFA
jgi:hypothetical protein